MTAITCLVDNRARPGFEAEHGLSLFIEHGDAAVLLDTGQSGVFLDNARRMGVDLTKTTHIILSHGHYDHSGGMGRALALFADAGVKPAMIMHPDAFIGRSVRRDNGRVDAIGIAGANRSLVEQYGPTLAREPVRLAEGLVCLGQIPRPDAEACSLIGWKEDGEPDAILDDTGFACMTPQGLVVITGCAHSGIINTVEYARSLLGAAEAHAVVGGLHCKGASEALIRKTHDFLKRGVGHVYGCHCTGDALRERGLGHDFMTGDRLEF